MYGSVTSTNFVSLRHDGHHLLVLQHCLSHREVLLRNLVLQKHRSAHTLACDLLLLLLLLGPSSLRGAGVGGGVSVVVVPGPEHIPALLIITCSRLHFPCFHTTMLSQEVSPPSDRPSGSPADGPVGKFTSLKGYQKYLVRIAWMPPMETALYLDLI